MKPFYTWKATFNDNSVINQYNKDEETLFREVENNKDNLKSFRLTGEDNSFCEVVLQGDKKAEINVNDKKIIKMKNKKELLNLVYSRRGQVRVKVGTGTILESRQTHRIGLENNNETIVVEMFPGLNMATKFTKVKHLDKKSLKETEENMTLEFNK